MPRYRVLGPDGHEFVQFEAADAESAVVEGFSRVTEMEVSRLRRHRALRLIEERGTESAVVTVWFTGVGLDW